MSIVFLADPRPHLEVGEWKQRKCVLSLQKVIPRQTGGGETTDRQTEGVRLDRESQRSYRIPDAGEVM